MGPRGHLAGAVLALAVAAFSCPVRAEAPACGPKITRSAVVPCALGASPALRGEQLAAEAVRGREVAASVLLPSNPVLSVDVGRPIAGAGRTAVTWSATLAQEIEIAGQRGARLDVARAELRAQAKRTSAAEREAAAAALTAYFDALAARDELALAVRLAGVAGALEASASTRAGQGLAAPVDAEVAYAASTRLVQMKAAAERRAAATLAALASALGLDPARGSISVEGELVPLSIPETSPARLADQALASRAEIEIAQAEGASHESRASLLRRTRVPNLTLSAFAQSDSLNERVIGGGIALPIPLLGPLGRTNAGEIAEATALAHRAETEVERQKRQVRLEVITAAQAFASRRRELDLFDPKRMARAEDGLASLGQELSAGRLSIRDALLAQQALIELLSAHLEAKRALCLASVELARAAGMPLDRGAP